MSDQNALRRPVDWQEEIKTKWPIAANGVQAVLFDEVYKGMGQEQTISTGERAADAPHRASFACLWDEINGDRALWKSNPWVWVVEFKRAEPTPGQTEGGR